MRAGALDNVIEEFRSGNPKAFEEIYSLHHRSLLIYADKMLLSIEEAKDVVAETFIKVWDRRANFFSMGELINFLRVTTHNACLNMLRNTITKERNLKQLSFSVDASTNPLYFEADVKATWIGLILNASEKLPARLQQIFQMAYLQGLKNDEIAAILRINDQTVRASKVRIIKRLRMELGKKHTLMLVHFFLS